MIKRNVVNLLLIPCRAQRSNPAAVAQEHNRSQEMGEKNVRRAKDRKRDLEAAKIEV